ncbi:hypothetical protein OQA88_5350 [Cercophora sp. LCS_1]
MGVAKKGSQNFRVNDIAVRFDALSLPGDRDPKEASLLHAVESLLDIALPKASKDSGAATKGATTDSTAATTNTSSSSKAGDDLYSNFQSDKYKSKQRIRLLKLLPGNEAGIVEARLLVVESPRHHDFSPRYLWVGDLCINQDETGERTAQVAFMGTIYSEARRVAVFLGMPTAKSYPLLDFLERDERCDDITQENGTEIMTECGMDVATVVGSFVEFCDRQWWERVWVIQEHYLAAVRRSGTWVRGRSEVRSSAETSRRS